MVTFPDGGISIPRQVVEPLRYFVLEDEPDAFAPLRVSAIVQPFEDAVPEVGVVPLRADFGRTAQR